MNAPKNICAIMFSDVSGSSKLYQELGDERAKAAIDELIVMMKHFTGRFGGKVIKTIGDEVMSCFKTANDAVSAASEMQRSTVSRTGGSSLKLRIGIDFGSVLVENKDLFGNAVNNAAFVSHVARGGQIVITKRVYRELGEPFILECREFDRIQLKGGKEKESVYLCLWETHDHAEHSDRTRLAEIQDFTILGGGDRLLLSYMGQVIKITRENVPFTIGRNRQQISLTISDPLASREHCQILFRRGKFVLVDHSTNGTSVTQAGHKSIYLRREELPLIGTGSICIGSPLTEESQEVLNYQI